MHARIPHVAFQRKLLEIPVPRRGAAAPGCRCRRPASVANRLAIAQYMVASGSAWSSFQAAIRTMLRAATRSVAMSASRNLQALEAGERLTELAPLPEVPVAASNAACAVAHRTGRDVDAAAIEAPHGDPETLVLRAKTVGGGHFHVVETICRVGWLFQPILASLRPKATPGLSAGRRSCTRPRRPRVRQPGRTAAPSRPGRPCRRRQR